MGFATAVVAWLEGSADTHAGIYRQGLPIADEPGLPSAQYLPKNCGIANYFRRLVHEGSSVSDGG